MLGEGDTFVINGNFDVPEKMFSISFTKAKQNLWFNLHYNGDNSYLFDNEIEIYNFKASNEDVNFPTHFLSRKHIW